jgi:tetratricopeptide (TPR) repeat protein
MLLFRAQSGTTRLFRLALIAFTLASCVSLSVQSQESEVLASIRGIVCDSLGKPVAGVTVHLYTKDAAELQTAHTDSQGSYAFMALRGGVYTIDVEMTGFETVTVPSIFLGPKESKNVDLNLLPTETAGTSSKSTAAPQFFDQPQFTVSGVTDTTSLGGHGSDTIVRTRETIAKDTVSLATVGANSPATSPATIDSLKERVEREPRSAEANCRLGQALIANGQPSQAIPYLERAAEFDPAAYEAAYSLALANEHAGHYDRALAVAQPLLLHHDDARLHHLLGDVEEKLGNPLEAVRQYQRAAELDPSQGYLFDWGSELLLHHAPEPAIDVFSEGHRRFPRSDRMLIGLGVAWFARGDYDQAARRLSEASDLNPKDESPYVFLGKIEAAEPAPSDEVIEKLHRFVTLEPDNAAANYYYAVALWKRPSRPRETATITLVQSLLERAVQLDPQFSAAHLQLGIVDSERGRFSMAIAEYQHAVQSSSLLSAPLLEEAHYRLAQAYREIEEPAKAKAELELYDQLSKQSAEEAERERHEIRQFVYSLRDQPPEPKP